MSNVHLYSFQQEGLNSTASRNRVAYYWDMGLGKTYVGSEKMYKLSARVNLIICQKSKMDDWAYHFITHYKMFHVCRLDNPKAFKAFLHLAENGESTTPIVGIINYELAWRRPKLSALKDFTLMLDESSLIQNRKAKQTKFILKLNFKNVILLSGTPCSGKYENLWTQLHLLGWNISEDLYNSQFVNFKLIRVGKAFHKTVDTSNPYKNVERLKSKLREYGASFMKTEECFDLPEQNFIDVRVPVSTDYKDFMKNRIVEMEDGSILVGQTSLTKRLYARMLCAQYSESKLDAFKDLLESTNDRIVVFYNFNDELHHLIDICNEIGKPVSQVNGSVKDLKAYEAEDDSVTLVQYQAGAKGLNLQKANKIIFYSPTERCEDYMQALKRIHRIGQKRPCFYYRMMCDKSVDERIYHALERGVDYTDELFKEDFKC